MDRKEPEKRIIRNDEVSALRAEIPDGHKHLRTTVTLDGGEELTFQEATVAAIVRAYIYVKTHPQSSCVTFKSTKLDNLKPGYSEWQLLEVQPLDAENQKEDIPR